MTSISAANRRPAAGMRDPLAAALVFSLVFHLLMFGGWRLARRYGWDTAPLPLWLQKIVSLTHPARIKPLNPADLKKPRELQNPQPLEPEPTLTFVEVDPSKAVPEPPKDAKFYSSKSTTAANPDPAEKTNVPKIDGTQTVVVKTLENQRLAQAPVPEPTPAKPTPQPLQPTVKPVEKPIEKPVEKPPDKVAQAQPKPEGGRTIGDLAMARPAPRAIPTGPADGQEKPKSNDAPETPPLRPRTIAEAKIRNGSAGSLGEKMKQAGGVPVVADVSLDVKGSPFGEYDRILIEAIRQCWYNDLDSLTSRSFPRGRVVVDFVLDYRGKVNDVSIVESSVDDFYSLICQGAIKKPAPFPPWPDDMRRTLGKGTREVRFTFYYY